MRFRLLHDYALVKRLEEQGQTPGGIIIPDMAREKPMEARVIAVGPGALGEAGLKLPMSVEVGDRVLLGKWSGTEVQIGNEEFLILKEEDILGVIGGSKISAKAA